MKTIKIPDWLYEELILWKNQYGLSNRLTSNILAVDKYQKIVSKGKKPSDSFYEWLMKEDYCPGIPDGVIIKIWYDSFAKFGVEKKRRNKMAEYILEETKGFKADL